jgi:hypothetical protein
VRISPRRSKKRFWFFDRIDLRGCLDREEMTGYSHVYFLHHRVPNLDVGITSGVRPSSLNTVLTFYDTTLLLPLILATQISSSLFANNSLLPTSNFPFKSPRDSAPSGTSHEKESTVSTSTAFSLPQQRQTTHTTHFLIYTAMLSFIGACQEGDHGTIPPYLLALLDSPGGFREGGMLAVH